MRRETAIPLCRCTEDGGPSVSPCGERVGLLRGALAEDRDAERRGKAETGLRQVRAGKTNASEPLWERRD